MPALRATAASTTQLQELCKKIAKHAQQKKSYSIATFFCYIMAHKNFVTYQAVLFTLRPEFKKESVLTNLGVKFEKFSDIRFKKFKNSKFILSYLKCM